MAIYLLNVRIDTADPQPENIPEDLSFNDQESVIEFVIEKILGFEDAIREYDDHDNQSPIKTKNVKIDLMLHAIKADTHQISFLPLRITYPDFWARLTEGFSERDCRPPSV